MSDELDIISELQTQVEEQRSRNAQTQMTMSNSMYQSQQDANLVQYQLDTGEMLSRIEHFLKGDILSTDENGNEYFKVQENHNLILFNEYGVNSVMSLIGSYIDKNTSLSHYDEMRINEILADLGDELANFIFCNYEKMGMDTEFKKSRYNLIVINILHTIESAYRRALQGNLSRAINTTTVVSQYDNLRPQPMMNKNKRSFNLFKPKSWI